MKLNILALSALVIMLASCEKEISIDYNDVVPLLVIEGNVNNESVEVVISETRNMDDAENRIHTDALIYLSDSNGNIEVLDCDPDGIYRSKSIREGIPGVTYTLEVTRDDKTYVSSSTMQNPVEIISAEFSWEDFMNTKMLYYTIEFADIVGEDNFYCYRMFRNGEPYRWSVLSDRGSNDEHILVDIACMSEEQVNDGKEEDLDDILNPGDEIMLEIQTIDKTTYDYLFSLLLSERTSTNPLPNFSGGCLGYFSAYGVSRINIIYDEPADYMNAMDFYTTSCLWIYDIPEDSYLYYF